MTAGNGEQRGFSLKAKEKILVQLYLYRREPDDGVFPFEVTQKGLSEHLGLRRSHVAVALQELAKDGLVVAVKGHVEGADRRQNAYCVTESGFGAGAMVRERLLEVEVPFEDSGGARTAKVSEIVGSRKASLASVIIQLERGGPVRDEIALVTTPEKKLISVFCPTCKKQIEVDNVFFDQEVGFDCPGCARPYRIVPAQRKEDTGPKGTVDWAASDSRPAGAPSQSAAWTGVAAGIIAALAIIVLSGAFCLSGAIMVGAVVAVVVWALAKKKQKAAPIPRTPGRAFIATVALSPVLLLMWHWMVAEMEGEDTIAILVPVLAIMVAGALVVWRWLPGFKGDYLLSAGLVLICAAAASMAVLDFGGLTPGMAMAAGVAGSVFVVLSSFDAIDKDAAALDVGMAFGAFLVLLTVLVLAPDSGRPIDWLASAGVAFLGASLVYLRVARETTGARDLSSHLIAALPMAIAIGLVAFGVLVLVAESYLVGAAEVAAACPFAYIGVRQLLVKDPMPRIALIAVFALAIILSMLAGLVT